MAAHITTSELVHILRCKHCTYRCTLIISLGLVNVLGKIPTDDSLFACLKLIPN